MWIVRWILIIVLILALVGFLGLNQDELVDVDFLFWESPPIPLAYALFFAFACGMVVHLLMAIFRQLKLRSVINKQKRQIRRLQDELENLRNLSIDDELPASQTVGTNNNQLED
ncbi:hypothetical protein CEE37_04530 [candidate division LCP-89 bacterium B3_LCP]|uniref:Lipopolysaccharide assembly protein A domain-containing protein n=1 Tax=candidate division LCP-89 bacterium B3_LCP TaxID=2012998 RepID=A0A532V3W1_UNCL8|nr:MAG: hypothetical protein CEE37_04530 [candidate division LCP-89 bacterium B3_LCP]